MRKLFTLITCILCLQTVNGQNNWTQVTSGTTQHLRGLHILDTGNGYIVGDSGTALRSTDVGNSWQPMNVPMADYTSVAFQQDPDTGFITPGFGSILVTYDGGNNWTPDTTTFFGLCYWNKIRIDSNNLNWLLYDGCFGNHEIITWNIDTGDTTNFPVYQHFNYLHRPQDIDFPSRGTAVVVGDSGMVLRTTDSGDNWSIISFPDSTQNLKTVDFVDANVGYAFSQDLFFPKFITTDGGQSWAVDSSWAASQTFFYPVFQDIEYHPNGNGFMAGISNGTEGVCFYNSYNNNVLSTTSELYGVDFMLDSIAYVVGEDGYIARYGDLILSRTDLQPQEVLGLYPNPTDGATYLVSPTELTDGKVRVFDLQGRMVYQDRPGYLSPEEAYRMELDALKSGVYYVELAGNGQVWRHRLVKVD